MANPLDAFVKRTSIDENDVRLPEFPSLRELVESHGLMQGLALADEMLKRHKVQTERVINERIRAQRTVTGESTSTTITVVAPTPPGNPATPTTDSGLAAHIAAKIVHGTTSPVVGESDEQSLERKTIGMSQPRDGRFNCLFSANFIPPGETCTIPANYNWVITGPMEVNGTLIVEGYFGIAYDDPVVDVDEQVYHYEIDPTSESLVPDDLSKAAIAYKRDGTGATYVWNTTLQQWN